MESVMKQTKNCIITSKLAYNNSSIEMAPVPRFPHLVYTPINETHYRWCGPMILVAQYLSKFTRQPIHLNNFEPKFENFFRGLAVEKTAIALGSLPGYHYLESLVGKSQSEMIKLSPVIDFTDTSKILASTRKGEYHLFKQFESFESEVYYALIVSIIVISIVIGVHKKSFKAFFDSVWTNISVTLNGSNKMDNKTKLNTILSSNWLIASTILMAAFSGKLRDLLIKPRPIYWIDSWSDLLEWKGLKIQTISLTDLAYFLRFNKDHPLSIDFNARSEIFQPSILAKNMDKVFDFEGIAKGKVALVFPSQYLHVLKKNLVGMSEDIDFHISNYGDSWKSCFAFYSQKNMNVDQISKFNLVIEIMRESGIYDYLVKVGLNPSRVGPDAGDPHHMEALDYEVLVIKQMKGIFFLFLIFPTLSIFILICEKLLKMNSKKMKVSEKHKRLAWS